MQKFRNGVMKASRSYLLETAPHGEGKRRGVTLAPGRPTSCEVTFGLDSRGLGTRVKERRATPPAVPRYLGRGKSPTRSRHRVRQTGKARHHWSEMVGLDTVGGLLGDLARERRWRSRRGDKKLGIANGHRGIPRMKQGFLGSGVGQQPTQAHPDKPSTAETTGLGPLWQ
jgi:hypothetical protein